MIQPTNLYGNTIVGTEAVTNMIDWANDLASKTFNTDAQLSIRSDQYGMPNMFYSDKWALNPVFFTQVKNIDWSGYSVITMISSRMSNEWGYGRGAALIGSQNFIQAYHYSSVWSAGYYNLVFVDVNGAVQLGTVTSVVQVNATYSDCALGRLSADIAVTVGVFPVIPQTASFNTSPNSYTGAELSAWVSNSTTSTNWANMIAAGQVAQNAAFVNSMFDIGTKPEYVPVYQWTARRELVLRYSPYLDLFKPSPKWEFFQWGRTVSSVLTTYKISTPVYKVEAACSVSCLEKNNIARGAKNNDSSSGAFIIVGGQPIFVGYLHYYALPYGAQTTNLTAILSSSPLVYWPVYGAFHSFAQAYTTVKALMSTYGLVPTPAKFCNFKRTATCILIKDSATPYNKGAVQLA